MIVLLFLTSSNDAHAQWHYSHKVKTFGGGTTARCGIGSIIQLYDNNLLPVGNIFYDSTYPLNLRGSSDEWLIKIDSNLNKINETSIGSSFPETSPFIVNTFDSGYAMAFTSGGHDFDITCYHLMANGQSHYNSHLFKFDKQGQQQWNQCFGDTLYNSALGGKPLITTKDHGFLLSAITHIPCSGGGIPRLLKLDSLGNVMWTLCMDISQGVFEIQHTYEDNWGNLYLGTDAGGPSNTYYYFPNVPTYINDVGLLKVSSSGIVTRANVYGGNGIDKLVKILPQKNGDLVLVINSSSTQKHTGELLPNNFGAGCIWLIRVDSTGTVVQESTIGGNPGFGVTDAIQLKNGKIMLACSSKCAFIMNQDSTYYHFPISTMNWDFLMCELDSNLNYIGAHSYGGTGDDKPYSLLEDKQGNIWVGGFTNSLDGDVDTLFNLLSNAWLLKLTPDTLLGIKPKNKLKQNSVQVYPNPTNQEFKVSGLMAPFKTAEIRFYDMLGALVLIQKLHLPSTSISTGNFKKGVYNYAIIVDGEQAKLGKLVVLY